MGLLHDTSLFLTLKFGKRRFRFPQFIQRPYMAFIILVIAILLLFPYRSQVQKFNIPRVGEVSKETVIAPVTFDIVKSQTVLEFERKEALSQVLLVFEEYPDKTRKALGGIAEFKRDIRKALSEKKPGVKRKEFCDVYKKSFSEMAIGVFLDRPALVEDVYYQVKGVLEKGIVNVLMVSSTQKLDQLRSSLGKPFKEYLVYDKLFVTLRKGDQERSVRVADVVVKEIAISQIMEQQRTENSLDPNALNALYEVLDHYLVANCILKESENTVKRETALGTVLPIKGKVVKDAEIVRKHQVVTDDIVEKLISLDHALSEGEQKAHFFRTLRNNFSRLVLVIFLFYMIGLFIYHQNRGLFQKPRYLIALALIVVLQIALIRLGQVFISMLLERGVEYSLVVPEYCIPYIFSSILISILFGAQIGYIGTIAIAIYATGALAQDAQLFFYVLSGGFVATYYTHKVRYRWDFFKAMLPVVCVQVLFIVLWSFQLFDFELGATLKNVGLSLISGFFSLLLAMIAVVFFEYTFDITTDIILVELADMNHPLLKRLSIEAPGTYNHCVLVGNLAESAAEKVDANPLLARVASYYHDVGKLIKPNYFTENQRFEKNIHDKLSPHLSTLIISSHVKDGVELARMYRLPSVIQNAIRQHHGTSTVSFFYEKARELSPNAALREEDFCYPGPKPQTKENAIIMLADSIEAASRSMAEPSPKALRMLVKRIIQDKFATEQLDECDLSFKDLERIVDGFMPVLQGIFHTRIEYPQPGEFRNSLKKKDSV